MTTNLLLPRSAHYTGVEYLKWEDIELKFGRDSSKEDPKFTTLTTLKYRKGNKQNALKIELGQLDAENNSVDITKLLVVYALCIGAVEEKTWEDLIVVVSQRPSKRFIWKNLHRPVFSALTKGERFDFFKPAGIDQQCRFLRRAAGLIDMMQLPVTHDLRRGAAADISSLKPSTNPEGVLRDLGHTHGVLNKEVTDKYVGRLKGDSWAARLDDSANASDDPFGVQFVPTSFVKRKIATKEIEAYVLFL
ncbi:hypothetical protein LTR67_008126 [Exophiala xenobiotica]